MFRFLTFPAVLNMTENVELYNLKFMLEEYGYKNMELSTFFVLWLREGINYTFFN